MRFAIWITALPFFAFGQFFTDTNQPLLTRTELSIAKQYAFIDLQCNQLQFVNSEGPNWVKLRGDLKKLIESGEGQLNFYHIGGSHLQADIYSHDFRTFLQSNWPGLSGERGWVFPFNV